MMKLQETKAMKLTEGGEADAAIIRKLQLTNDNARSGIITLLLQSIAGHVMNDLLEECSKIAGTKNPWTAI